MSRQRSRSKVLSRAVLEQLEERRLLSDVHLIGITGNQQDDNPDPVNHPDETLWDVKVGQEGTTDPLFMDGWSDINLAPDIALSISTTVGVTHGPAALRVEVPQDSGAYWGIQSGNIVNLLRAGITSFSYDMTLNNIELNGGSFNGTDNSFIGYAQSNVLAVQISTQANGFIQEDFASDHATDSSGQGANWQGVNGTRHITWDLTRFISQEGTSLKDFVLAHNPNDAHFWLPTQGGGDSNGHTGPMRFYFDNFQVSDGTTTTGVGDFNLVATNKLITLPFVPDTDAIGFDPETGLLHRTSGSESWNNDPTSPGYRDDQFMETVDPNFFTQSGIFNANYEGEPGHGPYGLDAPRPIWVLPADRRTDDQNTDFYKNMEGPDEYHALRDLTWSADDHLFYGADERGIFTLTPEGLSTFIGKPFGLSGGPKGITFHNFNGQRQLLVSEKNGPILWTIDPSTGQAINTVYITDQNGVFFPGVLSLVDDPTSTYIWGIAKSQAEPGNAFARELIRIDPVTGQAQSFGTFGFHMADLAFIVPPPTVTYGEFLYEQAPQRITLYFDQMMKWSIASDDFTVEKLGEGGGPIYFNPPVYDDADNTATITFPGVLPDGNYRMTLGAAGVTNDLNMALTQDKVIDFYVLNGDLNRDRTVSIADFIDLATHFNQPATRWSEGDLNYDGFVTIADFIDLASNFNHHVDPPAAPAAPAAAEAISGGSSDATEILDASGGDVTEKQEVKVTSKKAHKKHRHHRRQANENAIHWIVRAGAY